MSLLTSILPKITQIVSLYSSVKSEFERFRIGRINEQELLQATEDAKDSLTTKVARALVDISK